MAVMPVPRLLYMLVYIVGDLTKWHSHSPFLCSLWKQNRQSYLRLTASSTGKPPSTFRNSHKGVKGEKNTFSDEGAVSDEQNGQSSMVPSTNAAEILKTFRIHIVRVNGILFTRTRYS